MVVTCPEAIRLLHCGSVSIEDVFTAPYLPFLAHLFPLLQAGHVTFWSERQLHVGEDRTEQIAAHVAQADGVVLLSALMKRVMR